MNRSNTTTVITGGVIILATSLYCALTQSKITTPTQIIPLKKPVSSSSITYNVRITSTQCDQQGRALGGELMMLIDVAAGLVAAKFAQGSCLTISLDRVTFLQEIVVGDCLILSVAVNRSWNSSMEIGVRVMKESSANQDELYCCHAYLTFVKITPLSPPSLLSCLLPFSSPKKLKAQVPELIPTSTLERKRFLLAGRRRAHRIQGRETSDPLLAAFRTQLFKIETDLKKERDSPIETREERDSLLALQQELLVEAYMREDNDVRVEGDELVAVIEGFMEEVRVPLEVIKKSAEKKGKGGYRRLTIPSVDPETSHEDRRNFKASIARTVEIESPINLGETFAVTAWIIRPEHCNSKNILFGGRLIRFAEEVSSIAAQRVSKRCSWVTASIDSLTFKSAVYPGEVVYVRAYVLNTYDSSIEIFTLVTAENRNAASPTTRLVSEAFFTLVGIDPVSGRPLKGSRLRQIRVPHGPSKEVAEGGNKRREERLQDKRILQRVYG